MNRLNSRISLSTSPYWLVRLAILLGSGLSGINAAHAASLDPALLPRIQTATFEVVAAKPVHDTLSYEKPLPLHLLPYQQRTDKYYSIGTAFALGGGRYVTAAHVLNSVFDSLWGPPSLRSSDGTVFPIDQIVKFSLGKDFVVFTLKGAPDIEALQVDTNPVLNQIVYAVGNALGTGVVIRDGLYTSNTPEEQDGQWKWMRFSAAASPGNSGGPLLNKDGEIIGVILRKSANENLNYALPIQHVLSAPDNIALIDTRVSYKFAVFDTTLSNQFKAQFKLPLNFADFNAAYQTRFNAYCDQQLSALLASEHDTLFPNGPGSSRLLHDGPAMINFPMLIKKNTSGTWLLTGEVARTMTLADNGYIESGVVDHNLLFHLRKPDTINASELYGNPNALMDLLLKLGLLNREIGIENIAVTSLGEPSRDTVVTDRWERHWQVRVWQLPHRGAIVITFSLPVPDGYVTLMRIAEPRQEHDFLANLRALLDFTYVTYDGTLAQWKDFLTTAKLPKAFEDIEIDIEYGKSFNYTSKRVRFSYTPKLQNIAPDSMLTLGFHYFTDDGEVVWDVADVWAAGNPRDNNWINLARYVAPSADLDDSYQDAWDDVAHGKYPYDAIAWSAEGISKISAVVGGVPEHPQAMLYSAYYQVQGAHSQKAMKEKLDLLLSHVEVVEGGR